ncbi:type II secretion system protein [bacterium]|nr:type II secretion system protein [bacterium]
MQRPLAFTLVELLVVISILGLLAGLSIPAISAARNSALTAASTGNLHQINIMMKSYLAENNNFYPRAEETDNISWRRTVWEAANGSLNPDGQWTKGDVVPADEGKIRHRQLSSMGTGQLLHQPIFQYLSGS